MNTVLTVWDNRISPVFDVSENILLLVIKNGRISERLNKRLDCEDPYKKIDILVELETDTLICGAISRRLHEELLCKGINVLSFTAGNIEDVIEMFLAGKLPDNSLSMPGCRRMRRRMRRRGKKHTDKRRRQCLEVIKEDPKEKDP